MTTIRAFFLEITALFSNFGKRAGENPPPPPSSYARVLIETSHFEKKILRKFPQGIQFQQSRIIWEEAVAQMCSVEKGVLRNFAKFTG